MYTIINNTIVPTTDLATPLTTDATRYSTVDLAATDLLMHLTKQISENKKSVAALREDDKKLYRLIYITNLQKLAYGGK